MDGIVKDEVGREEGTADDETVGTGGATSL
jgi:hypothetical protein